MDGVTPVTVAFGAEGLLVTAIKNGRPFVRTLTWKELYKIGLKGKPMSQNVFLKKVSEKFDGIVKANRQSSEDHKKRMKQLTDLRKRAEQSRPSLPPLPPPPPPIAAAP